MKDFQQAVRGQNIINIRKSIGKYSLPLPPSSLSVNNLIKTTYITLIHYPNTLP